MGACGACVTDSDCPPNDTCATETGTFIGTVKACVCSGNSGCGGDAPVCVSPGGTDELFYWGSGCGCNGSGQCPSGETCDTTNLVCTQSCVGDASVCANNGVCDTSTGLCVECNTDADCAGLDGTPYCLTSQNTCVQCLSNSDCSSTPSTPTCDTSTNTCG
jgi:hypothetical protein